jgi:hypothetical protein
MDMGVWYVTREAVKAALDSKESARNNGQIDRAIESASRRVDKVCRRKFYPTNATRYFDWPDMQYSRSWRLWLNQDELLAVTSLTAGGVTIDPADYFLEPANDGPPYDRIEIDLDSSAAFSPGATHQRAVAVQGVFGACNDFVAAGTLTASLNGSSDTVSVSDSSAVGVGDTLAVGDERMLVVDKVMVDTGQNSSALTVQQSSVTLTGVSGLSVGEVILVDSERMLVVDVAGTTVTVKRAWDGSVLASHSAGADIYAGRSLRVVRGALGTSASAHDSAAEVTKLAVPGPIQQLAIAYAIDQIQQETSGYARTVGVDQNERQVSGRAITALEKAVRASYGRLRFQGV